MFQVDMTFAFIAKKDLNFLTCLGSRDDAPADPQSSLSS